MKIITCVAPVNIAVIKYCMSSINIVYRCTTYTYLCFSGGKRDENLILPLNDSISATLSLDYVSMHK